MATFLAAIISSSMRKISAIFLALPLGSLLFFSCKTVYQAEKVQYNDYRITQDAKQDNALVTMIAPYRDSVTRSMSTVVAVAGVTMEKKQPEGALGNMIVDAMYQRAVDHYKQPVDMAFMNYGGIRLPSIPAGNITRGKIFELSPFDNIVVLLKINGKTLQSFLDHISGKGGWPATGITWQIKDKKAVNVNIGGKPLDPDKVYTMTTIDYVANGGDDCAMLRNIPQINDGYLFRNAILEYMAEKTRQGKTIIATIENRVTNAN